MITPIINSPRACRIALETTTGYVCIDLETSGLERSDYIVSVGLLIDETVHILFVRSRIITSISIRALHYALAPLTTRRDLTIVGHNVGFDLGFLHREGLVVIGTIHDTEKLLRLVDTDRGKNRDVLTARIDRLAPPESPDRLLNYKLKCVLPQLLHVKIIVFDDKTPMAVLP